MASSKATPTARERFERLKDVMGKVIQPEPEITFLLSLVEAAVERASNWKYGYKDISRGRMKENYEDEIDQRLSQSEERNKK